VNSFQQPQVSEDDEYAWGDYKSLAEKSAYDISAKTNLAASPYAWDVSSEVPIGAQGVRLWVLCYGDATTAEYVHNIVVAWNYDLRSSYNQYNCQSDGASLWCGAKEASGNSFRRLLSAQFTVRIGASRKLYTAETQGAGGKYYMVLMGYWS
jgi:hypothetical protein